MPVKTRQLFILQSAIFKSNFFILNPMLFYNLFYSLEYTLHPFAYGRQQNFIVTIIFLNCTQSNSMTCCCSVLPYFLI